MEIVSEDQYRALTFIAACNRNHHSPMPEEVMLWHADPSPSGARYRTVQAKNPHRTIGGSMPVNPAMSRMLESISAEIRRPYLEAISRNLSPWTSNVMANYWSSGSSTASPRTRQELVAPAETVVDHLVRLRWLEEVASPGDRGPGLRLSDLGHALLQAAETDEDVAEAHSLVVLGRDDPLAYPTLIGLIANAGAALFVDPYLKLPDLDTLLVNTQVSRILIAAKKNNQSVIASMRTHLTSAGLPRRVEVRASADLHDRVIVADDGEVFTIGTSLNGVARTTTVFSPVPRPASVSLREEYERLWDQADLVGPSENAADGNGATPTEADPDHR